jgi:hypothetical protein
MYSLLIGGGLYRMSFQTLKDLSTNGPYGAPVKRQLALLIMGLVAVLVLAGQLARAAAGPGLDPQDRLPAWTPDGGHIAFERAVRGQTSRVLAMTAGGKSLHVIGDGTLRGWVPGTENLLVQVDEEHTFVQSDSSRSRPLAEFLGTDATAPPDGQRVAYLRNHTLYVAAIDGTSEHATATGVAPPSWDILGPVWSPDGTRTTRSSSSATGSMRSAAQRSTSSRRTCADYIQGSPYFDIINGLDGSDTSTATPETTRSRATAETTRFAAAQATTSSLPVPETTASSAAPETTRSSAGTAWTGSIAGRATTPSRPQGPWTSSPATVSTSGIRLPAWRAVAQPTTAGSSAGNSLRATSSATASAG